MSLAGKKIVVGVAGGIAAFKSVALVRELGRRGCEVRVVMTPAGTRFVGAATFTGITGHATVVDLWDANYPGEVHVELTGWCDAIVVAPATADLLGRAAAGLANDALLATLSCADCPVFLAPAMHSRMWNAPATKRAVEQLRADGAQILGPVEGALASGEQGQGRMMEALAVVDAVQAALGSPLPPRSNDLHGRAVLVSAGPTAEDLDPVRFLSNRSTGRMGFAVAEAAAARGADVTLVAGPVQLPTPAGVHRVDIRSARDLHGAVMTRRQGMDAIVMTAAVADYRPQDSSEQKLKKSEGSKELTLVRNPDILADLGALRAQERAAGQAGSPGVLVGFALETQDLIENARDKLRRKQADLIVANHANDGFGGDSNQVTLVHAGGEQALPTMEKRALGDRVWDHVVTRWQVGGD